MDFVQYTEEVLQRILSEIRHVNTTCTDKIKIKNKENYMDILSIIEKKRDKEILTKEEIEYFVNGYTKNEITDYQAAALIMAIFINGMTKQETTDLTLAMAHSGEILDLSTLNGIIVDKHSTGGVGDKVSLILLPIVSSLGIPVAKMSGRGLGFTGGTIDKLESIPGYKTEIDMKQFIENVQKIGISLISQTLNLAPADKKIYSLRDTISCVESIPLIASSIMSKKIASGAQKIVLDVTVGKGAFMKTIEEARQLAKTMIDIGKLANRETVCVLTNMNEPLGYNIGNSLEVIEAVNFLKGDMPEDVKQVILALGSYMIKLAGKGEDLEENKKKILENILNGKAYEKFKQLIEKQGGEISFIENVENIPKAKYIEPVYSLKSGCIHEINALEMGKITSELGAGRIKKEDSIDYQAGIVLQKKVADLVEEGEVLAYIHTNKIEKLEESKKAIISNIKIEEEKIEKPETILEIIEL